MRKLFHLTLLCVLALFVAGCGGGGGGEVEQGPSSASFEGSDFKQVKGFVKLSSKDDGISRSAGSIKEEIKFKKFYPDVADCKIKDYTFTPESFTLTQEYQIVNFTVDFLEPCYNSNITIKATKELHLNGVKSSSQLYESKAIQIENKNNKYAGQGDGYVIELSENTKAITLEEGKSKSLKFKIIDKKTGLIADKTKVGTINISSSDENISVSDKSSISNESQNANFTIIAAKKGNATIKLKGDSSLFTDVAEIEVTVNKKPNTDNPTDNPSNPNDPKDKDKVVILKGKIDVQANTLAYEDKDKTTIKGNIKLIIEDKSGSTTNDTVIAKNFKPKFIDEKNNELCEISDYSINAAQPVTLEANKQVTVPVEVKFKKSCFERTMKIYASEERTKANSTDKAIQEWEADFEIANPNNIYGNNSTGYAIDRESVSALQPNQDAKISIKIINKADGLLVPSKDVINVEVTSKDSSIVTLLQNDQPTNSITFQNKSSYDIYFRAGKKSTNAALTIKAKIQDITGVKTIEETISFTINENEVVTYSMHQGPTRFIKEGTVLETDYHIYAVDKYGARGAAKGASVSVGIISDYKLYGDHGTIDKDANGYATFNIGNDTIPKDTSKIKDTDILIVLSNQEKSSFKYKGGWEIDNTLNLPNLTTKNSYFGDKESDISYIIGDTSKHFQGHIDVSAKIRDSKDSPDEATFKNNYVLDEKGELTVTVTYPINLVGQYAHIYVYSESTENQNKFRSGTSLRAFLPGTEELEITGDVSTAVLGTKIKAGSFTETLKETWVGLYYPKDKCKDLTKDIGTKSLYEKTIKNARIAGEINEPFTFQGGSTEIVPNRFHFEYGFVVIKTYPESGNLGLGYLITHADPKKKECIPVFGGYYTPETVLKLEEDYHSLIE